MSTILAVYLHFDSVGLISEVVTRQQKVFCEMSKRIDLFHSKSFQNVSHDFCRWMFCTKYLVHFIQGQTAGTGTLVHQNQLPQITVYRYNTHFYLWSLDTAIHDEYLSITIIIREHCNTFKCLGWHLEDSYQDEICVLPQVRTAFLQWHWPDLGL